VESKKNPAEPAAGLGRAALDGIVDGARSDAWERASV
jgi:hypothetical protein